MKRCTQCGRQWNFAIGLGMTFAADVMAWWENG